MAGLETLLASPIEWSVVATGLNTTVTASKAAPGVGFRHYIYGLSFSTDGAPNVTGLQVNLAKNSGGTILDAFLLPTSALFMPIVVNYLSHPFEGDDNGDVSLTAPPLGNNVNTTVVLKGTTRSRG